MASDRKYPILWSERFHKHKQDVRGIQQAIKRVKKEEPLFWVALRDVFCEFSGDTFADSERDMAFLAGRRRIFIELELAAGSTLEELVGPEPNDHGRKSKT